MQADFNDYVFFAEVVRHGGFAAAGRKLRIPKSRLSRRIAALEARLGARLLERSSRRFRVTEVGEAFYARCRAMIEEAEQAEALVSRAQSEPQGLVRFASPSGFIEELAPRIPVFLTRHPKVRLQIIVADQPVDLIGGRIDLALRVRVDLAADASLTMRTLGHSRRILVASPALANSLSVSEVSALAEAPTLSSTGESGEIVWDLVGPDGQSYRLKHEPRMICEDFAAVRIAAAAGLGIALLPDHTCRADLASGRLVRLLPGWGGRNGVVHIVFTTRRGLSPAVRAFIDHLAESFQSFKFNE